MFNTYKKNYGYPAVYCTISTPKIKQKSTMTQTGWTLTAGWLSKVWHPTH